MADMMRVVEMDRRLVDAELRRSLRFGRDVPPRLAAAMRYAVMGPGKRIRPVLMLRPSVPPAAGTLLSRCRSAQALSSYTHSP